MRTKNPTLTPEQLDLCRKELPQLIRGAYYGDDLSALEVQVAQRGRQGEAMLCCPLTAPILGRIRHCPFARQQDIEVTHVPNGDAELNGQLLFRVRYDFEGEGSTGEVVSVHESALIAMTCRMTRRGLFRQQLCVTEAACCTEQDGVIRLPSSVITLNRKAPWYERFGEGIGEGLLEIVGEIFAEFIADLLDGV